VNKDRPLEPYYAQEIRNSEGRLIRELHSLYGAECMDAVASRHDLATLRDELHSASSLTELILDSKDVELLLLNHDAQNKLRHLTRDDDRLTTPSTASKVSYYTGYRPPQLRFIVCSAVLSNLKQEAKLSLG